MFISSGSAALKTSCAFDLRPFVFSHHPRTLSASHGPIAPRRCTSGAPNLKMRAMLRSDLTIRTSHYPYTRRSIHVKKTHRTPRVAGVLLLPLMRLEAAPDRSLLEKVDGLSSACLVSAEGRCICFEGRFGFQAAPPTPLRQEWVEHIAPAVERCRNASIRLKGWNRSFIHHASIFTLT